MSMIAVKNIGKNSVTKDISDKDIGIRLRCDHLGCNYVTAEKDLLKNI